MRHNLLVHIFLFTAIVILCDNCFCQITGTVIPRYNVSLEEAHIGSLEIDTMLLNSYEVAPSNIKQFYLDARSIFEAGNIDFTDRQIIKAAVNNNISLIGGPMLGDLKEDGISIWFRPSDENPIRIIVTGSIHDDRKIFTVNPVVAGKDQRIVLKGLSPDTEYNYEMFSGDTAIASGSFQTSPGINSNSQLRIAFGSCFHKTGLHNPNLINSILARKPNAMMLLGDIAVDDRENNFGMHRADYLLRDLSPSWKKLSANVPLYTSWDDHDYLNNDLSGVPEGFTDEDREELRTLWRQNWNNPRNDVEGIYFNTRVGPVEIIMLDTRSCRKIEERGEYGSYLGMEQLKWLKSVLVNSTASFKIISSGTMWSNYISNGKDSWGTWDTLARKEIFNLIEAQNISGVLLISGDRHGARSFTIPEESGFELYEFEAASLGGVPGPEALANDPSNQLFGYQGKGLKAFGEFTFKLEGSLPQLCFRLIDEYGNIMEEHTLPYSSLVPQKQ